MHGIIDSYVEQRAESQLGLVDALIRNVCTDIKGDNSHKENVPRERAKNASFLVSSFRSVTIVNCSFGVILRLLVLGSRRIGTPYWFHLHANEYGTNKEFRNVGYKKPDDGESP